MMVLGQVLGSSGLLWSLSARLVRVSRGSPLLLLLLMHAAAAITAGVMQGTLATMVCRVPGGPCPTGLHPTPMSELQVLVPVALHACQRLSLDPAPYVVYTALGANLGGAWTLEMEL